MLSAPQGAATHLQHQELRPGESLPAEPQGQGHPPQAPRDIQSIPKTWCVAGTGSSTPGRRGHPAPTVLSHEPGGQGQGLSPRARHLAQRQQSNLQCLLSPQTGRVTPAGLRGANALLLVDGETEAQGPTNTRACRRAIRRGARSTLERSGLPRVVPPQSRASPGVAAKPRPGRQTPNTLPNQLTGSPERIPGCRHRPGAQCLGAGTAPSCSRLISAVPLPPRASSAEGGRPAPPRHGAFASGY